VTGLAIIPDAASGLVKGEPADPSGKASANRKFSELIFAGPYVFTTIFPVRPQDRAAGGGAHAELDLVRQRDRRGAQVGARGTW